MPVLGIDTSNYTTSLALMNLTGQLLAEERRLLSVPPGSHGLRQEEAVFQHVRNLPELLDKLPPLTGLRGVAVSSRPRAVGGSYMPVFLVGVSVALAVAKAKDIPLFTFSHQANHLAAGLWSLGETLAAGEILLALHLSGGTSEVVKVQWGLEPQVEIMGESLDTNAGQFVDRVGVALGLPFPAGPHLEELARDARGLVRLPGATRAGDMSFSGPLSAALRLVGRAEPQELARAVEDCIARTVEKALLYISEKAAIKKVLLVGGVMANQRIKQRLRQRLEHPSKGFTLLFAKPQAARDGAIGLASLAREKIINQS
jgi:N6-L-threonylcarbamoyladenine synthase